MSSRRAAESSLAKILDKSQVIRLKQIQLQLQGPGVVLREDMMEKLGIDESQVQMLQEIRSDHRDAQRENGRARRDIMQAVFAKATPSQNNGQNADDAANSGNGGNNANGNGRNGGRRQSRSPRPRGDEKGDGRSSSPRRNGSRCAPRTINSKPVHGGHQQDPDPTAASSLQKDAGPSV